MRWVECPPSFALYYAHGIRGNNQNKTCKKQEVFLMQKAVTGLTKSEYKERTGDNQTLLDDASKHWTLKEVLLLTEHKNYMVPSGHKAGCSSTRVTIIRIATHKVWVIQTIEQSKREITKETMILMKTDFVFNPHWREKMILLLGIYYFVPLEHAQTWLMH